MRFKVNYANPGFIKRNGKQKLHHRLHFLIIGKNLNEFNNKKLTFTAHHPIAIIYILQENLFQNNNY